MAVNAGTEHHEGAKSAPPWDVTTFGDSFNFLRTANNSRAQMSAAGTVGYIHYGDLHTKWHTSIDCSTVQLPKLAAELVRDVPRLRNGDLVLADASEDNEGLGIAVEVHGVRDQDVVAGLHTLLLRDKGGRFADGFRGLIQFQPSVRRSLRASATGISVYGISRTALARIEVQRPPIPEQCNIVSALRDTDSLIATLAALIAKKRNIMRGVSEALLTGTTRLPGFADAWSAVRLGSIGATFGGLTGKTKKDFGSGTGRYVTFINVISNTIIDMLALDRVRLAPGEVQTLVRKGDLLFNGSSETPDEVGMCAAVLDDVPGVYLNSFCFGFRVRPDVRANALFFAHLFRGSVGRGLMRALAQGAIRYNLSKASFLKLEVPLPGAVEQDAIADVLRDMDSEIAALETRHAKTQALRRGMMQDLLTGRIRLL